MVEKKQYILGALVLVLMGSCAYIGVNNREQEQTFNFGDYYEGQYYYEDEVEFSNANIEFGFEESGAMVMVVATVEQFQFDNVTKDKYLRLKANDFLFDVVISEDVKTPYFDVGNEHRFWGVTKDYDGLIKLHVSAVN